MLKHFSFFSKGKNTFSIDNFALLTRSFSQGAGITENEEWRSRLHMQDRVKWKCEGKEKHQDYMGGSKGSGFQSSEYGMLGEGCLSCIVPSKREKQPLGCILKRSKGQILQTRTVGCRSTRYSLQVTVGLWWHSSKRINWTHTECYTCRLQGVNPVQPVLSGKRIKF